MCATFLSSDEISAPAGERAGVRFHVVVPGVVDGGDWTIEVGTPWLAGERGESWFGPMQAELDGAGAEGARWFSNKRWRVGVVAQTLDGDLAAQTRRVYGSLLDGLGAGWRPARIWNYVPRINEAHGTAGLEAYRSFCAGRAEAFARAWGEGFEGRLPAASAVGNGEDRLVVICAATRAEVSAVENPEQWPAYRYPEEHGPRSPSFARASRVDDGRSEWVFVSGTAAVKGHASIARGDLAGQIACMRDNLALISEASGLGTDLGRGTGWRRRFKVYLKRAEDLAAARAGLMGTLLAAEDAVTWLLADICRAELLIEVEASCERPGGADTVEEV